MLPGMELIDCPNLAVPRDVMHHVVHVESSYNPYAIGVVGGRLVRQPTSLPEAVSTAQMLEQRGYNFSLGLAQVNRYNLRRYGLANYETAFQPCANVQAGSRILAECYGRSRGDWGKSFSCYYSGNFVTGYRHGYVQKIYASMRRSGAPAIAADVQPIAVIARAHGTRPAPAAPRNFSADQRATHLATLLARRGASLADVQREQPPLQQRPAAVTSSNQPRANPTIPTALAPRAAVPATAQAVVVSTISAPRTINGPRVSADAAQERHTGDDGAFVF